MLYTYLLLVPENNHDWLAPYAYSIVLFGFAFFLFRVFESNYAAYYDRPLLRHYAVFRKVSASQKSLLKQRFSFYNNLPLKQRRQFEHRVATFMAKKRFIGREDFFPDEEHKLLIAAVACMLSFGRKNYLYGLVESVLIYPQEFYSTANDAYHKGEFNPRHRVLALSWKDFEHGYEITNDNLNLGIHEFMHAMQLEAKTSKDVDSSRFNKHFKNILKRLTNNDVKDKLEETRFFRMYAFTNQYEFMAVLAEYFFESPVEFKSQFPELYGYTQKLLNFRFEKF